MKDKQPQTHEELIAHLKKCAAESPRGTSIAILDPLYGGWRTFDAPKAEKKK